MSAPFFKYVNDEGRTRIIDLDKIVLVKSPDPRNCYIYFSGLEELQMSGTKRVSEFIAAYEARLLFRHECEVATLKFHTKVAKDLMEG